MTGTGWLTCLLALGLSSVARASLKIQEPADDLPKELTHHKYIESLQVGYMNLDTVVSKIYEPDNFPANHELINGMLESELKKPTLLKGVKRLAESVDLFRSLSAAYNRCDFEAYKSLALNYKAVDGRSHDLREKRRAIDMMIYDYAVEHARECLDQYVAKFEQISLRPSAKVVSPIVDEVLKALDADSLLIGENGTGASGYKLENVIERGASNLDLTNSAFFTIVRNIESLVEGKQEAKYFYPEPSRRLGSKPTLPAGFEANIFDKYLIVPCQQYNELFRDVFAPARLDAMIMNEDVGQIFPSSSESFNSAWIKYRVCKHLTNLDDRADILRIVKLVIGSLTKLASTGN